MAETALEEASPCLPVILGNGDNTNVSNASEAEAILTQRYSPCKEPRTAGELTAPMAELRATKLNVGRGAAIGARASSTTTGANS